MAYPFLPSVEEQLQRRRDETESGFACVHIDTCLSCYLNDHHQRDGELLLGVIVFGDTTIDSVKNELHCELDMAWDRLPDLTPDWFAKARAAVESAFADSALTKTFDSSLEIRSDEDEFDDYVQAWFLLTWEVPEEPEESD